MNNMPELDYKALSFWLDLAQWVSIIDWLRPVLYPSRPAATGLRPSYKPNQGRPMAPVPGVVPAETASPTQAPLPGRLPPLVSRSSQASTWSTPVPPAGWIDRVDQLLSPARR